MTLFSTTSLLPVISVDFLIAAQLHFLVIQVRGIALYLTRCIMGTLILQPDAQSCLIRLLDLMMAKN